MNPGPHSLLQADRIDSEGTLWERGGGRRLRGDQIAAVEGRVIRLRAVMCGGL